MNPAYETALTLKKVLEMKDLEKKEWKPNTHQFYVSDGAEKFRTFANSILPCEVVETDAVNIEQY